MNGEVTQEILDKILNFAVKSLSEELSRSVHIVDDFRDPLSEEIIQNKIISVASKFLPPHLNFLSAKYPGVTTSKKCDLVLMDAETKKNVMWWEIKILKEETRLKAPEESNSGQQQVVKIFTPI